MNEIRQYRPAFFEGFEIETVPFNTLDELLAIPWVKNFADNEYLKGRFFRFSVSGNHLMAEYRGGREWWVIGILKDPNVGLPAWDHGWYEVTIDGKPDLISGRDVSSSCGDEVRLRDGRIVQRRDGNDE